MPQKEKPVWIARESFATYVSEIIDTKHGAVTVPSTLISFIKDLLIANGGRVDPLSMITLFNGEQYFCEFCMFGDVFEEQLSLEEGKKRIYYNSLHKRIEQMKLPAVKRFTLVNSGERLLFVQDNENGWDSFLFIDMHFSFDYGENWREILELG